MVIVVVVPATFLVLLRLLLLLLLQAHVAATGVFDILGTAAVVAAVAFSGVIALLSAIFW